MEWRNGNDTGKSSKHYKRCYESHPVLKIGKGTLCGGSASDPLHIDADIYVSLQEGSSSQRASDPWESRTVVEVKLPINDMGIPRDPARFKKLVNWLCTQLQSGKKVHIGCIGGHGRTGMVLSAVVAAAKQKTDAIQHVRKHYCAKAVESKEQVHFLMKHYGVSKVEGSKEGMIVREQSAYVSSYTPGYGYLGKEPMPVNSWKSVEDRPVRSLLPAKATSTTKKYVPLMSSRALWKVK